jgi:hypothetical protein
MRQQMGGPGIDDLTEQLAENLHETWAEGKIKAGWTWAPRHDDELQVNSYMYTSFYVMCLFHAFVNSMFCLFSVLLLFGVWCGVTMSNVQNSRLFCASLQLHPLLVPYMDLQENEKAADRNTVQNFFLMLAVAGYGTDKVKKSTTPRARTRTEPSPESDQDLWMTFVRV